MAPQDYLPRTYPCPRCKTLGSVKYDSTEENEATGELHYWYCCRVCDALVKSGMKLEERTEWIKKILQIK